MLHFHCPAPSVLKGAHVNTLASGDVRGHHAGGTKPEKEKERKKRNYHNGEREKQRQKGIGRRDPKQEGPDYLGPKQKQTITKSEIPIFEPNSPLDLGHSSRLSVFYSKSTLCPHTQELSYGKFWP